MSFTRENHFRKLIQIYDFESIPFLISKGLNNLRLRGFPDRGGATTATTASFINIFTNSFTKLTFYKVTDHG